MKKHFFKSLFLGAFALVGVIGITSCSDKDDPGSSNPQFNKEKNEVNTSFVFSVSTGKQADTRQTEANVQNDGGFLGLDKAIMLTYDTNGKFFVTDGTAAGTAGVAATKRFDFATLLSPNEITAANSHRILDLALPIGTDAMLFYGSAHKTGSDAEQGLITYTTTGDVANAFTFALTSIAGQTGVAAKFSNGLEYLAAILTELVGVDDGAGTPTSWKKLGQDLTAGTTTQTESEKNLGKAFNALTTIGANEYRAGSLAAILGMMSDLYKTVDMIISQNTATTEPKAFPIATNLKAVMDTYFDPETNANNSVVGYQDLKSTLVAPTGFTLSVTADDMGDFPAGLGLPYGTALMSYNTTTNVFSAVTTDQALIDATATGVPSQIGTYMFPAELMYRANSSLRTSDTDKAVADFPNGVTNWDTDTQWTNLGWPTGITQEVTSSTRAAALAQNINYGTAMLETQVTLDDGTGGTVTNGTIADNKAALTTETVNAEIDPSNLELIGVLVGGQPDAANWEFLPTSGSRNAVIYDNVMNQSTTSTTSDFTIPTTGKNYTMVLDNYNTSGTQDAEVRVALEFKNNGPSFYGRDNLVREGGVFYLVGKLTLASANTSALQWDSNYQLPPLDGSGQTTQTNRVFIQDHITAANFKMDYTSLQKAYVTVPDLRSGQLTFGLSVDITWLKGLSFETTLGTN